MIVCLCFGVSDKKLNEIVSSGTTRLNDVQRSCAAGTKCGLCLSEVKGILKNACDRDKSSLNHEND